VKRILLTADAVGGVFAYALELARGLRAQGIEVVLAVMGPPASDAQRAAARTVPGLVWHEAPYRLEWQDDPWRDVDEAGAWLLQLARAHRVELVHLNGYAHGVLDFGVPKLVVAHSCVLSWWEAVHGSSAPRATYRERVRAGLCAADAVVAPTRAMRDALVRLYDVGPVRVIANGCDLSAFVPGHKRELIFAAGRVWDEAKNLGALLRVASALPWPVEVAGDPVAPDGRVTMTSAQLLGPLPATDVAARMREASIFASPARYEPFGLAILEAAASGCALVLGDIPSLRELWDGCALFVPPDDEEALAEALQSLCAAPLHRAGLARRARERAARFSRGAFTCAYRSLYQQLVSPREEPACASLASITP
jgi:glycogen synthase